MIRTTFAFEPRPGDTIRGDIRIPDGPPPRSAVVIAHGFKGFKDWGFFPISAERIAGAGHAVVLFNFSRNGVGSTLSDFDEMEKFAQNKLTLELDELLLVVDQVMEGDLLPRRPQRLGILGHSRGGGDAILATSEEPRIDALVTWNAVSHFDRWSDETKARWRKDGRTFVTNTRTGAQMPLDVTLLEDYEANAERLDIPAAAARIEVPWLIIHARVDLTVPVAESERLRQTSKRARKLIIEQAGHTFQAVHPFETSPPELDEALDATIAHFNEHLRG